jgi:uncharacterized protein YuzE
MDTLNLDYDVEADLLYASFGPPRPAGAYHFDGTDNIAMVGDDGTMVGFDIFGLRDIGERKVPLVSGRAVKNGKLNVTPATPWLHFRLHGGLLELWFDPEHKIVVRGLPATIGGDPMIVDLAPLTAYR